jgi:hypothetical protein
MSELAQMVFWAFVIFFGMLYFHYWATKDVRRGRWDWQYEEERVIEQNAFAAYRNSDKTYADYETQPFMDDYPRGAA